MKKSSFHVKKKDLVTVVAGKEKGKSGRILSVLPKKDRIIVEKVNMIKRHTRPNAKQRQGGIVEREGPIHISNVMLVCTKCNKPTRLASRVLDEGKRVRVCKKCGEIIQS
jgi:large subunit ribosomal protein L24